MAGCCDNDKGCCDSNSKRGEREIPDGVEPCCSVSGRRCLCLPYDDPWLISSQILTIASLFFGWICWATFFISLAGLTIAQVLWCARMRSGVIYGQVAIAGLTSVGHLIVAIYVLVAWRRKTWCEPWSMYSYRYDDDYTGWPKNDRCMERTWFAIGLVCALMWAAASACMFWFVKSGRHAKWEAKYTPSKGDEVTNQEDAVVADAAIVESEKEDTV